MKTLKLALAASLCFTATVAMAADAVPTTNIPVTGLKFFDAHAPLKAAPAYGDMTKGPHGTYVKMPAGYVSPAHTHTEDYWAVVVSGVGANGAPGSTDVPLPSGSYWAQKGKEVHVTKCLSAVECIFFVSQAGKFDYVDAK
jgi:beta-alanine degradation protein BauB